MVSGEGEADIDALRRDLAQARAEQSATADILAAIGNATVPLESTLVLLIRSAIALCGADRGVIWIRQGEHMVLGAHVGYPQEWVDYVRANPIAPAADAPTVSGQVAATGQVQNLADLPNDPRFSGYLGHQIGDYRGCLAAPLTRDTTVVGVIVLTRPRPGLFTDRQVELIRRFADQAVIAIENARLVKETQDALERQTATAEILRVISESPTDVQPVFNRIVQTARRVLRCETAVVLRCEGESFYSAAVMTAKGLLTDLSMKRLPVDVEANFPSRAIVSREVLHIPDWSAIPLPEHERRVHDEFNVRSALYLPLVRGDACIGVLALVGSRPDNFGEMEVAQAKAFRDQALIAIETARLFTETREALEREQASVEELRTAQDRLVQTEKLASLGQLTAGIAHEIKNPLNFVNNFASLSAELVDELGALLAGVPLADDVRREVDEVAGMLRGNLEKVANHGRRADAIVRNMLLHSRSGSGERRQVDVNALVEESVNLAYHGARAESPGFNVTLGRDLGPSAGEAVVLPQEITRVLLNVIGNGLYAVRKRCERAEPGYQPSVGVATGGTPGTVQIRIRDNGTGIPDDVKQKMFDPFFTTKPAGEGTGLGLSLSHDIVVKQHGGRIAIATEPGSFTEVTIELPRGGVLPTAGVPERGTAR